MGIRQSGTRRQRAPVGAWGAATIPARTRRERDRVLSLLNLPPVLETIRHFRGTDAADAVTGVLTWTARKTGRRDAVQAVAAALDLCRDERTARRVSTLILRTAFRKPSSVVPVARVLTARIGLHSLKLDALLCWGRIHPRIENHALRDSLSLGLIETLAGAFRTTLDAFAPRPGPFRDRVEEVFFTVMNNAVADGRTLEERTRTLDTWCRNVDASVHHYR